MSNVVDTARRLKIADWTTFRAEMKALGLDSSSPPLTDRFSGDFRGTVCDWAFLIIDRAAISSRFKPALYALSNQFFSNCLGIPEDQEFTIRAVRR